MRPHLHFRRQSLRDHGIAKAPNKEHLMIAGPTDHPNAIIAGGYDHPRVGNIENLEIIRADDGALYSAWRPTWRESLRILTGARIWIGVMGHRQPPITVLASHWPWTVGPRATTPARLRIPGCPTFEHWLECKLYRTALAFSARLGLICIEEGSVLRLDAGTILRREKDGGAFMGHPFSKARWKLAFQVIKDRMTMDGNCPHTPNPGWMRYR